MKVLLGVDLGTSAFKAVAVTADGQLVASSRVETVYQRPAPERVQFSADAQYQRLCRALRTVVAALPDEATPVSLCLSGASGNTVLLDGRHRPLAPAISWLDTRPGDNYTALLPGLTPENVRATVGWSWSKRFSLSQLAWVRAHRPSVFRRARFAPDLAYYHFKLTGRLVIDHSSGTNFFLQDQLRRRWHPPFLAALGIDESSLPELVASGSRVGELKPKTASELGLPQGLPVFAGCFDHPSAARSAGVLQEGDLMLSCGTSWVGFFPTGDRADALAGGLIVDPFLQPKGPWGAMFSVTAVGSTVDHYLTSVFLPRTKLSLDQCYKRCLTAAAAVGVGEEGAPIDPLLPLPADRNEKARLCSGYSLGQLSRRLMVGVALALRRRIRAVGAKHFQPRRIIMVGGPSANPVWTQIVADVLGQELTVMGGSYAGAIGAARLGGVGIGLIDSAAASASVASLNGSRLVIPNSAAIHYATFDWK